MKRSYLLLVLCLPVLMCNAQNDFSILVHVNTTSHHTWMNRSGVFAPMVNDKQVGESIIAPGITVNYRAKSNMALRFKAIVSYLNNTRFYSSVNPELRIFNQSVDYEQSITELSPGVIWFTENEKLNFFGGFEAFFSFPSAAIIEINTIEEFPEDFSLNNYKYSRYRYNSGIAIGPGFTTGCTINFGERIFAGFEIFASFQYVKMGGEFFSYETEWLYGQEPEEHKYSTTERVEGWHFSPVRGQINVGYNF